MKIYLIIVLYIFTSCKHNNLDETNKLEKTNSKMKIVSQENNFEDIMKLKKKEAIIRYGNPTKSQVGELKNMQDEFYGTLENTITNEERNKKTIIHELTWEKDSLRFITVWYEKN